MPPVPGAQQPPAVVEDDPLEEEQAEVNKMKRYSMYTALGDFFIMMGFAVLIYKEKSSLFQVKIISPHIDYFIKANLSVYMV